MFMDGMTEVKLDAKSRLAIPRKYMDELKKAEITELKLMRHPLEQVHCFMLLSLELFEAMRTILMNSEFTFAMDKSLRLISSASNVDIKDNRILLPSTLRKRINLDKTALLIGLGSYLELWDETEYYQYEASKTSGDADELGILKVFHQALRVKSAT